MYFIDFIVFSFLYLVGPCQAENLNSRQNKKSLQGVENLLRSLILALFGNSTT
jgi:hypothetical protein